MLWIEVLCIASAGLSVVLGFLGTFENRPKLTCGGVVNKWTGGEENQLLKAARVARFRNTSVIHLPQDWKRSTKRTLIRLEKMGATNVAGSHLRLPSWSRFDKYEWPTENVIRNSLFSYDNIDMLTEAFATRQWPITFYFPFNDVSYQKLWLHKSPLACAKEWYTRSDPLLNHSVNIDKATRAKLHEILNSKNGSLIETWRQQNIPPYSCAYYYALDKAYCSLSLTLDEQVTFLWSLHQLGFLDYDLILEVKMFGLREKHLISFWGENEVKIQQIVLSWYEVTDEDRVLLQGENNANFLEFFATMKMNTHFIIALVVILNDLTEGCLLSQDLRIQHELLHDDNRLILTS